MAGLGNTGKTKRTGKIGSAEITTAEKLIRAAETLLDEGGNSAVTLRAVGHSAGLSHNAPYRHFSDRSDLLSAVAENGFRTIAAELAKIEQSQKPPIQKIEAALNVFVTYEETYPARYRLLLNQKSSPNGSGQLETMAMETFIKLSDLVRSAQEACELPDIPTSTLTGLIYATVHGLLDFKAAGRLSAEKGLTSISDGIRLLLSLIRLSETN